METKHKILDIAMNLNRIGNWAADDYWGKQKRIEVFLNQTSKYLNDLDTVSLPESLRKTLIKFIRQYKKLENEGRNRPKDVLEWAEKMMTWGNILTHRASLIK